MGVVVVAVAEAGPPQRAIGRRLVVELGDQPHEAFARLACEPGDVVDVERALLARRLAAGGRDVAQARDRAARRAP